MDPGNGPASPGLSEVLRRYGGWISGTLRTRFPRDAEDLEQEVVLRLARHLPRLESRAEESVRALVSRVLRSVMVDEIRRRKLRPAGSDALVDEVPSRPPESLPAEVREEAGRAKGLFALLSDDQRRVLRMHFQDGLGLREIADVLGIPRGTVAAWYSRALTLLRERLT